MMKNRSVSFKDPLESSSKPSDHNPESVCSNKVEQGSDLSLLTDTELRSSSSGSHVHDKNFFKLPSPDFWTFKLDKEGKELSIPVAEVKPSYKLFYPGIVVKEGDPDVDCYFLAYCNADAKRLGPGSQFSQYWHALVKGILFLYTLCTYYF